ncbi:MAG TPA: biotin/lipoyl-binding protein, partial [Bacteroidia bacterium]|nr:biotin/lipoyl-binding protein [Bacteroidia bacterium]
MKAIRFATAMMLLATLLTSCGGKEESKTASDPKSATTAASSAGTPDEVVGIGRVEPEGELIPLASIESGVVANVHVKQGDVVKAGDPLLELDHEVLSAQIDQVRR